MSTQQALDPVSLADEICDSICELSGDANYPDLLAAVRKLASLAQAQAPVGEPVGIVQALNVCGEPMGDSTGVDWLRSVPLGAKLYASPQPLQVAEPIEMSPEFTDTARAALLWVLWHHQGASSQVGQPIRFALGMAQHERLNEQQVREAKRWEALATTPATHTKG